jgi:hypothetical protein
MGAVGQSNGAWIVPVRGMAGQRAGPYGEDIPLEKQKRRG